MKKYSKIFTLLLIICFAFILIGCNETDKPVDPDCVHEYEHGVCSKCGYKCPHTSFDDEICSECGITFQEICEHTFTKGVCDFCDYHCPHTNAKDGFCPDCNSSTENICVHTYTNGVCTKCGYGCKHERLNKGFCLICGFDYRTICKHIYVGGTCTKCTHVCDHGTTHCGEQCSECGQKAGHRIEGGVCTMCGYEMKFVADEIPSQFLQDCPQKGTVEKTSFISYDYVNKQPHENTFFVYLPYGYDPNDSKEYNVLYLLHGSGENAAYWLAQLSYKGGYTEKTKVVLDNLHYYNVCEPTIVVTPTENLNTKYQFYQEIVKNIMPLAETKYKTKAHMYGKDVNDVKIEDFIPSRDYRAYAGLSLGSMIGWSIMAYDLPYFSYYGYYSGGTYASNNAYFLTDLEKTLQDPNCQYDIKYAYHSCGDDDVMCANHISDYNAILKNCNGKLVEGVNTSFLLKPGFKHNYNAWIIDLYNSLGYAFFKYNEKEPKE